MVLFFMLMASLKNTILWWLREDAMETDRKRCKWVSDDPLYIAYHDNEWGKPIFDDLKLFEFIVLEGMQAGLSWIKLS